MTKKKKQNQQKASAAPVAPVLAQSAGTPFLTPRRAVMLSLAVLCLLWLIQFGSLLLGSGNLWEDVIQLEYPSRYFTRMALFGLEFPHWNPFSFNGMPFFATGQGALYPPNFLLTLLPVSDTAFWRLLQAIIVLHVLIAGVCMLAYLRFKGRSRIASLFGAIAFMLGGYMINRVIHSSIICIVAWLPLLLMLLERGVRENKPKYAIMGGLLLGAVMQAGHAQVMFYAIIFLLAYAVYFVIRSRDQLVKRVLPVVYFFAIAAGLCMVQYLPLFEAGAQTSRIEYTLKEASEGSMRFVQLLTALLPKVFGAGTGDGLAPSFWLEDGFSRLSYYNYWESCFYFGVSTLVLALLLFRKLGKDRSLMFASVLLLASFAIALGGNFFIYKILFSLGIPGFNSFRHTPRIMFVWAFLFPVIAAAALDSLDELKSKKLKAVSLSLCAAALVLGIVTALGGLESFFPLMAKFEKRAVYASGQGGVLIVNILLLGTVLTLFFTNIVKLKTAKILLAGCLVIDMLSFAAGQHIARRDGADVTFKMSDDVVEAVKAAGKNEIFRANTRQFIIEPGTKLGKATDLLLMERNQGYVSGIEIVEGYNPFRLKYASLPLDAEKFNVMLDLMNIRYYVDPHSKEYAMQYSETCLPRAKLFYKAKIVGAGSNNSVNDSLVLDYMNSDEYRHYSEVVVTDRAFAGFADGTAGKGSAKITKYKFNRIELDVDTDSEAILWLSEIWYPAWKAAVNGEKAKIHRANYSFRAVIVPAGASKVVLKFDSIFFNIGALISLLTLIAALTALTMGYLNRKSSIPQNAVSAK